MWNPQVDIPTANGFSIAPCDVLRIFHTSNDFASCPSSCKKNAAPRPSSFDVSDANTLILAPVTGE